MEPAASIIRKLGGEKFVATVLGTAFTAPYRWQHPREKGGTGGLIPQRHHVALLAHARQRQVRLSAEDFLPREAHARVTGSPR
jgi:hypothetical protein